MKNNYIFEKVLGSGTFGTTWKAKDKLSRNFVAIKIFKPNIKQYLWENEITIMKNLSCSPYIACLIDSFTEGQNSYLVMSFINGKNLLQYNRSDNFKPSGNQLLHDLIKGIQYIHFLNIVHQDVKDENVMYDQTTKTFKYIDFGLSCIKKGPTFDLSINQFPCGTYGSQYIASPGFEKERMKKAIVPWSLLESHDYWGIGLILLRWYTFRKNNLLAKYTEWLGYKPSKKFIETTMINTNGPRYYLLQEQFIKYYLNNIRNLLVRAYVRLLLDFDDYKRIDNFNKIVELVLKEKNI